MYSHGQGVIDDHFVVSTMALDIIFTVKFAFAKTKRDTLIPFRKLFYHALSQPCIDIASIFQEIALGVLGTVFLVEAGKTGGKCTPTPRNARD